MKFEQIDLIEEGNSYKAVSVNIGKEKPIFYTDIKELLYNVLLKYNAGTIIQSVPPKSIKIDEPPDFVYLLKEPVINGRVMNYNNHYVGVNYHY
jgi:hypothetical protein